VASGIIFVSSSMFQAMGNTIPSLITSITRVVLIGVPLLFLSRAAGFTLQWVWLLSVAATFVQLAMNLVLLQKEFRRRLNFEPAPVA
jgi:Na+-driven multidrug efflux pump